MSEKRPEPAPTCLLCGESGRGACQCDHDSAGDEYDPFEYVPDRISPVTAHGLAWLDTQLSGQSTARFRSFPVERQASVLADLMETGAIGLRSSAVLDLFDAGAIRASAEESNHQEADR